MWGAGRQETTPFHGPCGVSGNEVLHAVTDMAQKSCLQSTQYGGRILAHNGHKDSSLLCGWRAVLASGLCALPCQCGLCELVEVT